MEKKRYDNLDIIKAFAIIAVVTLHVPLWNTDFVHGGVVNVIQYAFRLMAEGVPFFITINGFLLMKREQLDLKKHVYKMIKMMSLLIIWGIIMIIAGSIMSHRMSEISFSYVYYYLMYTMQWSDFTGVLWFIQGLITLYLVYPVLWYIYKNNFVYFKYFFVVICLFVAGLRTLTLVADLLSALSHKYLEYFYGTISFFSILNPIANQWFVFYFCLGGMIWHYREKLEQYKALMKIIIVITWPAVFIIAYLISMCTGEVYDVSYNFGTLFMIMFIISVIILSLDYKNSRRFVPRFLASIGQNTFGIYLSHSIFIGIVHWIYPAVLLYERVVETVVVIILSYLFTIVAKKIPYVRFIVEL